MLKTISAAVLAVSMVAAPALAADSGKSTQTPATTKTVQAPAKNTQAPAGQTAQVPGAASVKGSPMNANAKMHHKHHRRYHHTSAVKGHSKVSLKHGVATTRRS